MKSLFLAITLFFSFSSFAAGVCTNDKYNPAMQQLCRMQGQGQNGKGMCQMTTGCRWITTYSQGICKADRYNPGFAQACAMQGRNGGEGICKMTSGCVWIELE